MLPLFCLLTFLVGVFALSLWAVDWVWSVLIVSVVVSVVSVVVSVVAVVAVVSTGSSKADKAEENKSDDGVHGELQVESQR